MATWSLAPPDHPGHQDQLARQDLQVSVWKVPGAGRDQWADPDPLVHQDWVFPGRKDFRVQRVVPTTTPSMGLEAGDPQVPPDPQGPLVLLSPARASPSVLAQ